MSGPFPEWQEFAILSFTDEFLGRIGFEHQEGTATIWFALRPEAQGYGFASEALLRVISYLADSGLTVVKADCAIENVSSARLLLRCGFVEIPSETSDCRMFRLSLTPTIEK